MGHAPDWTRQNMKKGGAAPAKPSIRDMGSPFHGAKMQHFADGGEVKSEEEYKSEGLKASADEKVGFFERLRMGNIDDPKSEAYKRFGAGRGRQAEAFSESARQSRAKDVVSPEPEDDGSYARVETKRLEKVDPPTGTDLMGTKETEDRGFTPVSAPAPVRAARTVRNVMAAEPEQENLGRRRAVRVNGRNNSLADPRSTEYQGTGLDASGRRTAAFDERIGFADGGMVKNYADGGLVRASYGAPNECTYNQGPGVRSRQDYKK